MTKEEKANKVKLALGGLDAAKGKAKMLETYRYGYATFFEVKMDNSSPMFGAIRVLVQHFVDEELKKAQAEFNNACAVAVTES